MWRTFIRPKIEYGSSVFDTQTTWTYSTYNDIRNITIIKGSKKHITIVRLRANFEQLLNFSEYQLMKVLSWEHQKFMMENNKSLRVFDVLLDFYQMKEA